MRYIFNLLNNKIKSLKYNKLTFLIMKNKFKTKKNFRLLKNKIK